MIKIEKVDVLNLEGAVRGMRNPMNSWERSDSRYDIDTKGVFYDVGENDLKLMSGLCKAGEEHRKFCRQIFVSMDITCHHVFWAEFDTYKVGTTRNSCSKMHRIHVKPFELDDFSHEGISECGEENVAFFEMYIVRLESLRCKFNDTQEKKYWRALLEMLPMGYNLKATVTFNYENALNIIKQRRNHKVFEWNEFIGVLLELPYMKDLWGACENV